jgi:hypothetical protein
MKLIHLEDAQTIAYILSTGGEMTTKALKDYTERDENGRAVGLSLESMTATHLCCPPAIVKLDMNLETFSILSILY